MILLKTGIVSGRYILIYELNMDIYADTYLETLPNICDGELFLGIDSINNHKTGILSVQ